MKTKMKKLTILFAAFAVLIPAVSALSAPANDMFANRITISGDSGSVNGSNDYATIESGEPDYAGNNTVWWRWTAPLSGACSIDTCGSDFDTYLAVYTGNSVDALSLIARNDDGGCGNNTSKVCIDVTAGQTYQIQVSGYSSSYEGNIILNWNNGQWSDWMVSSTNFYTNTYYIVDEDNDTGNVLTYKRLNLGYIRYYRTSACDTQYKRKYFYSYPDGFTIRDKKGKNIIENESLPNLDGNSYVSSFNGEWITMYNSYEEKYTYYDFKRGKFVEMGEIPVAGSHKNNPYSKKPGMLVYDGEKVILYGESKNKLEVINSQTIENFDNFWFTKSAIYVETYDYSSKMWGLIVFDKKLKKEKGELTSIKDFDTFWLTRSEVYIKLNASNTWGLSVYDKKLKKERWNLPLEEGEIGTCEKGLVIRKLVDISNNTVTVTYTQKGKESKVSPISFNYPKNGGYGCKGGFSSGKFSSGKFSTGKYSGCMYWTNENGTNSPITCVDKKGKKIVDNKPLTEAGPVWTLRKYDGKYFGVSKYLGNGVYDYFVYKVKGLKLEKNYWTDNPWNEPLKKTGKAKKSFSVTFEENGVEVTKKYNSSAEFEKKIRRQKK